MLIFFSFSVIPRVIRITCHRSQQYTIHWEIFKVQNFQGLVPFANKFSKMAFYQPLIIMERVLFVQLKFRGCKQIHEKSEIILPQKFPNIRQVLTTVIMNKFINLAIPLIQPNQRLEDQQCDLQMTSSFVNSQQPNRTWRN